MKISTTLSLFINKDLSLDASALNDKFIIFEEPSTEEPKMQILEKTKTNNANSVELF